MQKISLGIPFYNTSNYIQDAIRNAVKHPLVQEIVINDDHSSEPEWAHLNHILEELKCAKIKLFRNYRNTGAFRNKFLTVLNCSCAWVYLLDSDNYGYTETYETIATLPARNPWVIYAPQSLSRRSETSPGEEDLITYRVATELIGRQEAISLIQEQQQWFDWFINTGNYVVARSNYLEALKHAYIDRTTPKLEADTAAAFYFALKHGMQFRIVPNMSHHHRLRANSNWHACGPNSLQSVQHYKQRILVL